MDCSIFAVPREVTDIDECYFYHTIELPGYGKIEGEWDLRKGASDYLGGVEFTDKRVLEIGTASGFLCFYMENQGAEVVAYDLSENESWDIVPFSQYDYNQYALIRKAQIKKINNAYWLSHRVFNSSAKMVYGTVYEVPEQIGMVDISTFGSVLLHVRDPFLALQQTLRLTKETVIVTDVLSRRHLAVSLLEKFTGPCMRFLPNVNTVSPKEGWWTLSPKTIVNFIGVLGFEEVEVKYHMQKYNGKSRKLYTIVGHRTKEIQPS